MSEADLLGPDGINRGYPNRISRLAVEEMEQKILARFGYEELARVRAACQARRSSTTSERGSTAMYGSDYREPPQDASV